MNFPIRLLLSISTFMSFAVSAQAETSPPDCHHRANTVEADTWEGAHTVLGVTDKLVIGESNFVESHTRTGGNRILEMAEYVSCVDMIGETFKGFSGKFDGVKRDGKGGAAIRFLEAAEGTVVAIVGVEDASKFAGVVRVDIDVKAGARIKESRHSGERPGFVLAVGDARQQAISNSESALREVAVEVV